MIKKLILILMMLLVACCGHAWGVVKIDINPVTPYINEATYAADSAYMYGGIGSVVKKIDAIGTVTTAGQYDFGAGKTIQCVWTTPTAGKIFILVKTTATSLYDLYLSNDGGATLQNSNNPVLSIGDEGGAHIADVYALHRGFTTATIGGVTTYFIGEYNVNGSRVAGGTNDKVRFMSSTDGITWTAAATWNTNGTNYTRHIHAVVYDAATGHVYVCFGDTDAQSGIVNWDGVGAWADNTTIASYNSRSGFTSLSGSQSYRTVDLLVSTNYVHWATDTSSQTTANSGFYRAAKTLATPTRTNTDIQAWNDHYGWTGLVSNTGNLYMMEEIDSASGTVNRQAHIWTSADEGASWSVVGLYGMQINSVSYANLYKFGNNLVFSDTGAGAGKNGESTTLVTEQGNYAEEFPTIIHPVYFVLSTGSGTNGMTPATAWTTPKTAFESGQLGLGIRLILGAENYVNASPSTISFRDPAAANSTTGMLVVEGQGVTATSMSKATADTGNNLFKISATPVVALFKKFKIFSSSTTANYLLYLKTGSTAYSRDMVWGDVNYNTGQIMMWTEGTFDGERSRFDKGQESDIFNPQLAGSTTILKNCVLNGGVYAFSDGYAGATVTILNSTIVDYKTGGVRFNTNATDISRKTIKNNIFYSTRTGAKDIVDNASLTETDTQIDYNRYSNGLTNIANSGGSHSTTGDPLFKASTDYRLQSSSPCRNAGVDVGLTTDFLGKKIRGLPDIGAYEFQPSMGGGSGFGGFGFIFGF
jgi:hypothetical protein